MEDPRIVILYLYLAGNDGALLNRYSPLPGGFRFCRPATVRAPAKSLGSVVGGAGGHNSSSGCRDVSWLNWLILPPCVSGGVVFGSYSSSLESKFIMMFSN